MQTRNPDPFVIPNIIPATKWQSNPIRYIMQSDSGCFPPTSTIKISISASDPQYSVRSLLEDKESSYDISFLPPPPPPTSVSLIVMATTISIFHFQSIFSPPNSHYLSRRSAFAYHRRSTRPRLRLPLPILASAVALESTNGAVATSSKDAEQYGRKYFPLAAVVGQVILKFEI